MTQVVECLPSQTDVLKITQPTGQEEKWLKNDTKSSKISNVFTSPLPGSTLLIIIGLPIPPSLLLKHHICLFTSLSFLRIELRVHVCTASVPREIFYFKNSNRFIVFFFSGTRIWGFELGTTP
jgi:hypothetical protein